MEYQVCHAPSGDLSPGPAQDSLRRRGMPFLIGLFGAAILVLIYLGIVWWAQDWSHAVELLSQDRIFVGAIATGFGVQIGLYAYLRLVVHHGVRMAAPTAAVGVGTGTSSVAMVACCLHHVTDVLPIVGLSGAAIFLNDYRVLFMAGGLMVNGIGVLVMLRVVFKGRAHLKALMATARMEA